MVVLRRALILATRDFSSTRINNGNYFSATVNQILPRAQCGGNSLISGFTTENAGCGLSNDESKRRLCNRSVEVANRPGATSRSSQHKLHIFHALRNKVMNNLDSHAAPETRAVPGQPWVRGWDDFKKGRDSPISGNQ